MRRRRCFMPSSSRTAPLLQHLCLLLLRILLNPTLITVVEGKICFMVYQLADNNLEFYLRKDYLEISQSPALTDSENVRTWIYHDGRNGDEEAEGRSRGGDPLPNTVDASGVQVKDSFTGSRYMRYDPTSGKMKIEVQLQGEIDSDLSSTVQNFLRHAMGDCVGGGYTEMFVTFASHAGGFAGYGGDKSTRRRRRRLHRRNLLKINLQTNQSIARAIRAALTNTVGANSQLQVLGFDACLMQAAGAADDYIGLTKYLLASEAVEPGHGWAYNALTASTSGSALDLAKDIVTTFLEGLHGRKFHNSPKTLSILDMNLYTTTFVPSWESLCSQLTLIRQDVSLYSFLGRARASAVAYEGLVDAVGTVNPSAVDIGSFLVQLDRQCNPTADLGVALKEVRDAYANMFVVTGVGPGTSAGTGMHITWPHTREYKENVELWDAVLFDNDNYKTTIMPNYRSFLQYYLTSSAPRANSQGTSSVCSVTAVTSQSSVSADPNALILNATAYDDPDTGMFRVETDISSDVSQMWVEYGIDLSTPLRPFLKEMGYTPRKQGDEYLILLGGDVIGQYNGSKFSANWDQNFYFLNITSSDTNEERGFEALYVFDEGDGSKKVPVMYFPEERREDVGALGLLDYLFFDSEFWERNGGRFSFLKFSVDEAVGRVNENLNLFISDDSNGFSEQPQEAGGLIIPLIYVDAFIQGTQISTLPGGFNQTVIEWKTNLNYNLLTTHADRVFSVVPSTDAVIVNVYAFNHGDSESEPDSRSYDVIRRIQDVADDDYVEEPTTTSSGWRRKDDVLRIPSYAAAAAAGAALMALL